MNQPAAVDTQDFVPLYRQLYVQLRQEILSGQWSVNGRIPSEKELCQRFSVSRGTLRKALDELTREGLLHRQRGKGSYVGQTKVTYALNQYLSVTERLRRQGLEPSSRVMEAVVTSPDAEAGEILRLGPGEQVNKLTRLRYADGRIWSLETSQVPLRLCPRFLDEDWTTASIYDVLSQRSSVPVIRARGYLEPVTARKEWAQALEVPEGAPLLLITMISLSLEDRPVVISRELMRSDSCRFLFELG